MVIQQDFFDWQFYCNYYDDLKKAKINTYDLAVKHYIKYGKKENRIINYRDLFFRKKIINIHI